MRSQPSSWSLAALTTFVLCACSGGMTSDDYVVVLRDGRGLRSRSPVFVAGVEAGEVTGAALIDGEAHVSFSLAQEHASVMTSVACASVAQYGVTGPTHLAIDPGSRSERARQRPLAGGRLHCVRESSLDRTMSDAAGSAATILERAASGEGTVGRLLRDPDLAMKLERFLDRGCTLPAATPDPPPDDDAGAGGSSPPAEP